METSLLAGLPLASLPRHLRLLCGCRRSDLHDVLLHAQRLHFLL